MSTIKYAMDFGELGDYLVEVEYQGQPRSTNFEVTNVDFNFDAIVRKFLEDSKAFCEHIERDDVERRAA